MATLGFIGTGNMGGALARAACKSVPSDQVFLANRTVEKAKALAEELDCRVADNEAIAQSANLIFLGVKPQYMAEVMAEICPILEKRESRFILVSMAAGLTIPRIRELAGKDYPVIRIMPNTPAAIGEGMVFYDCSENVTKTEEKVFLESLAGAGRLAPLADKLMDAGSAVAGCGPAFADLFIEALADGGVACGLPRALALESAAQMMLGTAKLMLETGKHPGQLKDAVCSPGGATIQGIRALEEAGFRGAVMDAVIAAWEKSQGM
ncbi:pyrroline-5-carboxylate reductase [Dysosmobacter sp.]|uniref:pyrroline-5-carboxylate reductase n=1 Tax=Dysosmobacter sp. TaxID=2591382 RepID=UPI002A8B1DE7|nr:pyrroline-5-carboxylate reductase [Dysosmobacter sp.]MDY3986147.1 pyrroline-5-carboxylate reductase [Dysosmobacter sp.]